MFRTFYTCLLDSEEFPSACEAGAAAELALGAAGFAGVFFLRKKFFIFGVLNEGRERGIIKILLEQRRGRRSYESTWRTAIIIAIN